MNSSDFPIRKPAKWHRRRSHDGVSWRPPTLQDVGMGLWCARCHARHPYNGSGKLLLQFRFDQDGKPLNPLWLCPIRGDVLGELDFTRRENETRTVRGDSKAAEESGAQPSRQED